MSRLNLGAITAYAIAVKHGFEGTEEEWLNSLKGGITIDDELSDTSTNPLQNKVITKALNEKVDKVKEEVEVEVEEVKNKAEIALNNAVKAEQTAKEYADEKARTAIVTAENNAKEYTNQKVTELEQEIDNTETNAKAYTDEQIAEVDEKLSGKVDEWEANKSGYFTLRTRVLQSGGGAKTQLLPATQNPVQYYLAIYEGGARLNTKDPVNPLNAVNLQYLESALANVGKMYLHNVNITAYQYLDENWNNVITSRFELKIINSSATAYSDISDFTIYRQPILFAQANSFNPVTGTTEQGAGTFSATEYIISLTPTISGVPVTVDLQGQYGVYTSVTDELIEL